MIASVIGGRTRSPDIARAVCLGAGAILAAAALAFLPVQDGVVSVRLWFADLGWIVPVAFTLIYVFATLALLPVPILAIAGGLLFGLSALPLVLLGATVAASLSFLTARHGVRERLRRALLTSPNLRTIDAALAVDGWRTVALLRVAPTAPLWIQPWLLGTTRMRAVPFIAATAIGIVPGALLAVSIGAFAAKAVTSGATLSLFASAGALVILLIATVSAARSARGRLAASGFRPDG